MFFDSQEFSVYSMNYEEIAAQPPDAIKSIIWEGHGLFSWILENSHRHEKQISGEVNNNGQQYSYEARVTVKLKWVSLPPIERVKEKMLICLIHSIVRLIEHVRFHIEALPMKVYMNSLVWNSLHRLY